MSRLYDPVRGRFVAGTPEEFVRQELLRKMISQLGYPKGLLAVEKEVGASGRRADIVCYVPNQSLLPLLVVECKAAAWTEQAREQAFGYNQTLGAPFVCLAAGSDVQTLWFDGKGISSVPFLPPYRDLVARVPWRGRT